MKRQILALLSFVIVLGSLNTVEASSKLPSDYQNMYEQLSGNDIEDIVEEDTSIPLKITGPSKIVIYDGDKLSEKDLLSKYSVSRDVVDIRIVKEKCYWIAGDGKTKIKMDGTAIRAIKSQLNGFDPTFVDIPQHITLEAKSWNDGSVVRKNIILLVKHNKEKKVNKYVYMRCNVNVHEKPNYESKNLGEDYDAKVINSTTVKKIKYNTKIKVLSEVKVGKYKWYKIKWNNKVGYIFADNASNKKLPTLKTYIHETDAADEAYEKYNTNEERREDIFYDHNGVMTEVTADGLNSSNK